MNPLRLATFNMESLDDRPAAAAAFDDRAAVLRPQLQRLRADILCLQEINGRLLDGKHGPRSLSGLDRLIEGTEYAGRHRVVSTNQGGIRAADHHNLVILSRLPILEHAQIRHKWVSPPLHRPVCAQPSAEVPEPVEWDRPVLTAAVGLPGGRVLHVINVHLRAPRAALVAGGKQDGKWNSTSAWAEGFYLAAVKRAGQAFETRMAVDRIFDADPGAMIAVCGDFNADDRETPVRTIRGDEEDVGNGHLAARTLISVERGLSADRRFSAVHHGRPIMLDHILASRTLMGCAAGVEIHNEALGDELTGPLDVAGAPDSYHAPLVAEFLIP